MGVSKKIVWINEGNIFVVRLGSTSNEKISESSKKQIVQTYTFSHEQWVLASTRKGFGMKKFFALDASNCLDCPFSMGNGNGGCYTHKFNQYVGFLSLLRSISPEDLTPLDDAKILSINDMCRDCLLYTSPSPRDGLLSRMPSSA